MLKHCGREKHFNASTILSNEGNPRSNRKKKAQRDMFGDLRHLYWAKRRTTWAFGRCIFSTIVLFELLKEREENSSTHFYIIACPSKSQHISSHPHHSDVLLIIPKIEFLRTRRSEQHEILVMSVVDAEKPADVLEEKRAKRHPLFT